MIRTKLPSWTRYVATDKNGDEYAYEIVPSLDLKIGKWKHTAGKVLCIQMVLEINPCPFFWEHSLIKL